ncbi:hypothetical protein INR49_015941 [Caranx melampygus]|nr:hypothetical protein INR49_015941 [Caranx melampygus]
MRRGSGKASGSPLPRSGWVMSVKSECWTPTFYTRLQTGCSRFLCTPRVDRRGSSGKAVILRAASGLTRQELCAICTDCMAGGERKVGRRRKMQ